jgi:hypothetical protein
LASPGCLISKWSTKRKELRGEKGRDGDGREQEEKKGRKRRGRKGGW